MSNEYPVLPILHLVLSNFKWTPENIKHDRNPNQWQIQEGVPGTPAPPPPSNFLCYHAIFEESFPKFVDGASLWQILNPPLSSVSESY